MEIVNLIFGKPLKSSEERAEQIGPAEGIPIFGLDALSSAAYGPEAALSLLIPLFDAAPQDAGAELGRSALIEKPRGDDFVRLVSKERNVEVAEVVRSVGLGRGDLDVGCEHLQAAHDIGRTRHGQGGRAGRGERRVR